MIINDLIFILGSLICIDAISKKNKKKFSWPNNFVISATKCSSNLYKYFFIKNNKKK